jgi:hypothetical protein
MAETAPTPATAIMAVFLLMYFDMRVLRQILF